MEFHPSVIIGAGLTGLSCAWHLGADYLLLEKENEPGGIVRTRVREEPCGAFFCDGTGHWLHLRNAAIKELVAAVLPGGFVEYERRAVVHLRGVFTPYPFQANLHGLPHEVVAECLLGFLKARHPEDFGLPAPRSRAANFHESLERLFGAGICRHFMVPYNEKLLGVKLEEIEADYADRFIPRPSVEEVVRGSFGSPVESLGYNAKFLYPRHGGIGALPRALAGALPLPPRYGASVAGVDLRAKTVMLANGALIRYKQLLNTMPLPALLRLDDAIPPEVRAALAQLRAATVHYFDIGVRGPGAAASEYHWIYFPEPEYIFYRAGWYSAVHRESAPAGCRSYYVEMSGGVAELLARPDELRARVLADLRKARVLAEDDEVLFMELRSIPYAYVIFDAHYERARKIIVDFLAAHDVRTHGRWGGRNYGGMEDALLEGKAAAAEMRAALSA